MKIDVIGIGNALVDIEVRVDDSFIQSLNVTKGGMTLSTPEDQNRVLDQVRDRASKISSGGSAANTIHGLGSLGGSGYYVGRVADDDFGRHYTEDMHNCGVGFPGPDAVDRGTGTCVILVTPDSERTMLTHLGISSQLHPENVDSSVVETSRMVYIEGYLWTGEETRAAAEKMAETAKHSGKPVALTLSDAFIVNTFKQDLVDFIRWKTDILFCNNVEACAMFDTKDEEAAFEQLQGMCNIVFMTRGKEGSWASDGSGDRVEVRCFPVTAVDTTGAGDLFAAGVLFGLCRGMGLRESAIMGSYCAAQVVTHMGGRMPGHAHSDVDKILDLYEDL